MNNYNRYYDRQNTQNQNNAWPSNLQFTNFQQQQYDYFNTPYSSNYGIWSQPQETPKAEFVDKRNRRVISRESLFADPEVFYSQGLNQGSGFGEQLSSNSWTDNNWLMAGNNIQPQEPEQGPSHRPHGSKLQRKIDKAVAQPVQMTKAQSMMQKMGWQGGALGRTGEGIVEPITPNAIYASKTRGFGQVAPKQKKIVKQPRKDDNKEFFNTNVLLNILEFVKNDNESEVLFEPSLYKSERKCIHKWVNDVINGEDIAPNVNSMAHMDIMENISAHNKYVLGTQSEGEQPNRCLCLYKEAPGHVYLITPTDLKDQKPEDETDDKSNQDDATNHKIDEAKDKINETKHDGEFENKRNLNKTDNGDKTAKNDDKKVEANKMEVEEEETNPFLRSITRNLRNNKDKEKPDENISEEVEKDSKDCNIENVPKELDIKDKIIEYFKEFSTQDTYTEMRFLGPFNSEELDSINDLINNVHSCVHLKAYIDKKYDDILKSINDGNFIYDIKQDPNGGVVIYKLHKDEPKQS